MVLPQGMAEWTSEQKAARLNEMIEGDGATKEWVPVIKSWLHDEDTTVRKLAVTALWDYPHAAIIEALCVMVRSDPSPAVRAKAVTTLGGFVHQLIDKGDLADYNYDWPPINGVMPDEMLSKEDYERVKDFLIETFHDEGQALATRQAAVEAVSFVRGPDVAAVIREAYEQAESGMKASALFAMGRNRDKAWAEILLKELKNPDPEIQLEAARAVGECCVPEAGPALKRLARSERSELKLEAIWSLGRIGGTGVHRLLAACVSSDDADVREVAQAALRELERSGR
jgi:HEAT repeat protein